LRKKQHFHTTISLKSITMAFFLHVSAKNGVSRQLNVNKSHDIQFPWAVMPSEPMTIAGLSESLPPAKISVSAATAHGGGFSSLFW
jgi:hypothetical protein